VERDQIPDALRVFEELRKPRASDIRHRPLDQKAMFALADGSDQEKRGANFVRVQIMSCSSGSGSTTLQKVDERRGKTLPRPTKMESNPTMVSKGQESHLSCNICNILGSIIVH
jgi:hypothetical protein